MKRQTCIHTTCPSITKFAIEVIPRKQNVEIMSKPENLKKLKSGMFCVLECGMCTGRIQTPALGIWNPQCGIQNLILSWSTLHGV